MSFEEGNEFISDEVKEVMFNVKRLTGSLVKLNLATSIFLLILVIVSLYYGISNALEHGLTWEVVTVINGVETITTRNTMVNLGMSMAFCFMLITSATSFAHLFCLKKAWSGDWDEE